ncbi:MAG: hypothetical protein ATN36_06560 [Epulopiscium sp. Nele67-Bin005]|nr:MAG: hypothetical protein ATN36_06560 [Epulopiscium sp. Nele67-Bin005]
MIRKFVDWIKRKFGFVVTQSAEKQIIDNDKFNANYSDVSDINITVMIASKLAKLATADAELNILDTQKHEQINEALQSFWYDLSNTTSMVLSTGGVALVPRVNDGVFAIDLVAHNRLIINSVQNHKIKEVAVLAETKEIGQYDKLYKWINQKVDENNVLTISSSTVNERGVTVEEKEEIFIQISNCDEVLLAYFKCPSDNRRENNNIGVPITFGAEKLINDYKANLEQLKEEYDSKKGLIFMDSRMFSLDENGNAIVTERMARAINGYDDFIYQEYSPLIRYEAYEQRSEFLARQIEKQIGLSCGILSKSEHIQATATEIKRANVETESYVKDIQKEIVRTVDTLVKSFNVLANCAGFTEELTEYNTKFTNAFSDDETYWAKYVQANSLGIVSDAELRQLLLKNETLAEAQIEIGKINENSNFLSGMIDE